MNCVKKLISTLLVFAILLGVLSIAAQISFASESYATGDIIEFGYYPQSEIRDSATLSSLNALLKDSDWISYNYYSGIQGSTASAFLSMDEMIGYSGDYMKYADVVFNEEKYRAVRFTEYRPFAVFSTCIEENSNQDDNGYYINNIYFFKYEPIEWIVLDPDSGLVIAKDVLDAQPFQNGVDEQNTTSVSNWSTSSVRRFLYNDFMSTAFTNEQKQMILDSENENLSYHSITGEETSYPDGLKTNDKCFLLSYADIINPKYEISENDSSYNARGSDYARCQGTKKYSSSPFVAWYSRTAISSDDVKMLQPHSLDSLGEDLSYWLNSSCLIYGIRPALKINDIAKADAVYNLNYNANGGTNAPTSQIGAREYMISKSVPQNGDRKFLGWSVNSKSKTAEYHPGDRITLTRNTTLYAIWSEGIFTATFNSNGGVFADGSTRKTISCYSGDYITVPDTPTKAKNIFAGWKSLPAKMPSANVTYNAIWTSDTNLTFNRYPFSNTAEYFKTTWSNGTYYVKQSDLNRLFEYVKTYSSDESKANNITAVLRSNMENGWAGSCFGMASTTVLDYNRQIDIAGNFGNGAASLSEVSAPRDSEDIMSVINYYMLAQYIDFVQQGSTGVISKTNVSAWNDGLRLLVSTAQKGKPFLFNYRYEKDVWSFGKITTVLKGHAVTCLDCTQQSDGTYKIRTYDNNFTEGDAFIYISSDFSSCTMIRPDEVEQNIVEIEFYEKMDSFDKIDIDGANNDMNVNPSDFTAPANSAQIMLPGDGKVTLKASNGKTAEYSDGSVSGNLPVLSKHMIVYEDENGEDTAGTIVLTVSGNESYTFTSEDDTMDIGLLNNNLYASATTENANKIVIGNSSGVDVYGQNVDYTVSLVSKESTYCSLKVDGIAENNLSLEYSGEQMILTGADGDDETVTVLSDKKQDVNEYSFDEGYSSVKFAANGNEGEVDILGYSDETGDYNANIRKIKDAPKIKLKDYQSVVRLNDDLAHVFEATTQNVPKGATVRWISNGKAIDNTGNTITAEELLNTNEVYDYWDYDFMCTYTSLQAVIENNGVFIATSEIETVYFYFVNFEMKIIDVKESGNKITLKSEASGLRPEWEMGWAVNEKIQSTRGDTFTLTNVDKYVEIQPVVIDAYGTGHAVTSPVAFRKGSFKIMPSENPFTVKTGTTKILSLDFENRPNKEIKMEVYRGDQMTYTYLQEKSIFYTDYNRRPEGNNTNISISGEKAGEEYLTITVIDPDTEEILDRVVMKVIVSDTAENKVPSIQLNGYGSEWQNGRWGQAIIKADVKNLPEGYSLRWYLNGSRADVSSKTVSISNPSLNLYKIQAQVYIENNLVAKSNILYFEPSDYSCLNSISIRGCDKDLTVNYRSKIILEAQTAQPLPEGLSINWVVNDSFDGDTGKNLTIKEARSNLKVKAYIVDENDIIIGYSKSANINVNTGFFAKLMAFFRGLFGSQPVVSP